MSLVKFENSIVDQLIGKLVQGSTEKLRQEAHAAIKEILKGILHESVRVKVFGSGPLKTYLPESDIDLTVLFQDHLFADQKLKHP
jgi:DNA polymerase sigma